MHHYSLNDLRKRFDSGTYARGHAYAHEGKVRTYAWQGLICESEVAGSGGSVYHQHIRLNPHRFGIDIAGSCSCPMDLNCKHVVEVLVDSLKRGHEPLLPSDVAMSPALAKPSASHATTHWLMQLALAREASAEAHQPAGARESIAWVLLPKVRGDLHLYLCKARFKADGTIASATALSSLHNLFQQAADVIAPTMRRRFPLGRSRS